MKKSQGRAQEVRCQDNWETKNELEELRKEVEEKKSHHKN